MRSAPSASCSLLPASTRWGTPASASTSASTCGSRGGTRGCRGAGVPACRARVRTWCVYVRVRVVVTVRRPYCPPPHTHTPHGLAPPHSSPITPSPSHTLSHMAVESELPDSYTDTNTLVMVALRPARPPVPAAPPPSAALLPLPLPPSAPPARPSSCVTVRSCAIWWGRCSSASRSASPAQHSGQHGGVPGAWLVVVVVGAQVAAGWGQLQRACALKLLPAQQGRRGRGPVWHRRRVRPGEDGRRARAGGKAWGQ